MKNDIWMFRIMLSLVLFALTGCNAQSENDSINELVHCLNESDITQLENALTHFEERLVIKYPENNLSASYLSYLKGISSGSIPLEYFLKKESKVVLDSLKKSGVFDKIWVSLETAVEDLRDEQGKPIDQNPNNAKFLTINKNGDYQKCVLEVVDHKAIIQYLNFTKENPGMSFGLTSKRLFMEMTENDLNKELNRLVVALGFYYEFVFMTHKYAEQ